MNIIDGDSIIYRCAYGDSPVIEKIHRAEEFIDELLKKCGFEDYIFTLSTRSFRYEIYPEYKANRIAVEKPDGFGEIKDHINRYYKTLTVQGYEADDLCMTLARQFRDKGRDYVVSHIDKDLDQIPGKHYNYNKKEFYNLTQEEADREFFKSLFLDQSGDNLKTCKGIGNKAVDEILKSYPVSLKTAVSIYRDGFGRFKGYGKDWKLNLIKHYKLVRLKEDIKLENGE